MRCIKFPSVACLTLLHFSTPSDKRHDFREKGGIERKMSDLLFSTNLSETFLTLTGIQRDTIINLHKSSCKYPFRLSGCN